MKCDEFKTNLIDNDTLHSVRKFSATEQEHIEKCDGCRAFAGFNQKLDNIIRKELQQVAVPARVKERLRQNQEPENNYFQKTILKLTLLPAVTITALLVIFFLPDNGSLTSMNQMSQFAITDHINHPGSSFAKGIPPNLAAWGKEKIGRAITAPVLPFAGSILVGVTKCILGDCKAAHLSYEHNGKHFSVFVIPEEEIDFAMNKDKNYTVDFENHQVTLWKSNQQVYILVI